MVELQYGWRDTEGEWFRTNGDGPWEFDEYELMGRREVSVNDRPITEAELRQFGHRRGTRSRPHDLSLAQPPPVLARVRFGEQLVITNSLDALSAAYDAASDYVRTADSRRVAPETAALAAIAFKGASRRI